MTAKAIPAVIQLVPDLDKNGVSPAVEGGSMTSYGVADRCGREEVVAGRP